MFPGEPDFLNRLNKTIRNRVLRGLALNRAPGLHFPGNFLDVSFDRVGRGASRLSIDPGAWCAQADGQADLGSLAMLADLALAVCMRARLGRATRLATVSMHLQFTGVPRTGRLVADSEFQEFFRGATGRLGMSRVEIAGRAGQVCHGSGSFMALDPPKHVTLHPVPLRSRKSPQPRRLDEESLDPEERKILGKADAAIAAGGVFIDHFWGIRPRDGTCTLENGLHVGNRVGHVQGGILFGMAAATACSALPPGWRLSGISAWYVSPGDATVLRARSKVVHQGRLTAVLRTQVTGRNRRRVLEVVTTHCAGVGEMRA
jgi:acyl-coenzyme A thioesterase PaaI-like protein